jgi:hypothetical protein
MIWFRTLRRFVGRAALALFLLLLVLFAAVQAQQWLLRWRAERLMADMHRIRLYQTTWPEAQELIRKWGAWGHWDRSCLPEDCEYSIAIGDYLWGIHGDQEPGWLFRAIENLHRSRLLGGRIGGLRATFTVHDGTIWRTSERIAVDVPPELLSKNPQNIEYGLLVDVKSRQQLNRDTQGDRILGPMDQLAEHPYFVAGSPSGCEICLAGEVTYSTRTPQSQIDELSDFNLSCFTRFVPCKFLPDLYPAARGAHLSWMFDFGISRTTPLPTAPDCNIPVWALGRDFNSISEVKTLTTTMVKGESYGYPKLMERGRVQVLSTLKGSRRMEGLAVDAFPFAGDLDALEPKVAEHMQVGQRYLLLWQDEGSDPPMPPGFSLQPCGVQPDTPQVLDGLKRGMAMNDEYKDHWQF